eukprot:10332206-Alexandrium_andersonii.AAC.1
MSQRCPCDAPLPGCPGLPSDPSAMLARVPSTMPSKMPATMPKDSKRCPSDAPAIPAFFPRACALDNQ